MKYIKLFEEVLPEYLVPNPQHPERQRWQANPPIPPGNVNLPDKYEISYHIMLIEKLNEISFIMKDLGYDIVVHWGSYDGHIQLMLNIKYATGSAPRINISGARSITLDVNAIKQKFLDHEDEILEYFDRFIEILENEKREIECQVYIWSNKFLTIRTRPNAYTDEDTGEKLDITDIFDRRGKVIKEITIENLIIK